MSGGETIPPVVMSREEQVRRAHELMHDPLLLQAFAEITESAQTTWRQSENAAQREEQWHKIRAIFELQRVLNSVLQDEKLLGRRERLLRGGW